MNASQPVPSADRVLHVLAVLAQQGRALNAAELAQHTGLARSTLYRQLARLKRWGFVLETATGYAPGPMSLQLALGFDDASNLVRHAHPEMEALARQSNESVGLIIAVNDQAICLDMVESPLSLRCSFQKGRSVPLRDGASAKCVLAHLPEAARHAVLDAHYPPGSAHWHAASATLESIRQAGFVVSAGEVDEGVWGASVPLFGPERLAMGAITLMAPISRVQDKQQPLVQSVVIAAARISRLLSAA